jgi:site-specific DNA-methyltransferase (adenine-specific)
MMGIELIHGDCLEKMQAIPDGSIDMIMSDPPYGTTNCRWDSTIPFEPMWAQLKRIVKPRCAIVMMACQPFTSALIMSNLEDFKCSWVYKKRCASNFAQAKCRPMREHEDVLIFSIGKTVYYPIKEPRIGAGLERSTYKFTGASRNKTGDVYGAMGTYAGGDDAGNDPLRYPSSVREFNNRAKGDRGFHPTQKPVALMEYMIKTYTNEGDTVLDFCMGSGTTGVACQNLGREFIGIEMDAEYFEIAKKRIDLARG